MKIQRAIITSTTVLMILSLMLIIGAVLYVMASGLETQSDALVADMEIQANTQAKTGNLTLQQSIAHYIQKIQTPASTLS